jgi:hypothetical protein
MSRSELVIPHGTLEVQTRTRGTTDEMYGIMPLSLQVNDAETQRIVTEDAIFIKEIDNWVISAKNPTSGYSFPSLLFVAAPTKAEAHQSHLIYDAPLSVQVAYWEMVRQSMLRANEFSDDPHHLLYHSQILVTGHHCRFRQYPERPSGKSIYAHHDHGIFIPLHLRGKLYRGEDYGLPQERDQVLHYRKDKQNPYKITNFMSYIQESFDHELTLQTHYPHGYSFEIPEGESLGQTLLTHFQAYKSAMEAAEYLALGELGINISSSLEPFIQYGPKKGRVIQPAYTQYLQLKNDGSILCRIAAMYSGVGGPERAGIKLFRGPQYKARFDDYSTKLMVNELAVLLAQKFKLLNLNHQP